MAWITIIPDIELMKYANNLVRNSSEPGLQFEHVPGARQILMGREILFNEFGHRGSPFHSLKPENERRIYFMGSSITLGWGVDQQECFSAIAGRLLNKELSPKTNRSYVSINAGVSNFNTSHMAALYNRDIGLVHPDVTIMQYFIRDIEPQGSRDNSLLKFSYFAAFVYKQILGAISSGSTNIREYYGELYKDNNPNWVRTKNAILQVDQMTSKRGTPLAVILIPDLRDPSIDGSYSKYYSTVKNFLIDADIDVIDPREVIDKHLVNSPKKGWVHIGDPHPNAMIHDLIGHVIFDYLASLQALQ